jgi:hypothetical protein
MYQAWSTTPSQVDLEKLWKQLGVRRTGTEIDFDASAPYARIREAITTANS